MRARGCKLRMNHRNFLGSSNLLPNQCPAIVISAGAPARPAQQSTPLGRPRLDPAEDDATLLLQMIEIQEI